MSGAGKSTVSKEIAKFKNAEIIDADKVVRDSQRKGEEYYKKIVESFGREVLKEDGELDREKIAKLIFFDKSKKEILDRLTLNYIVPIIKRKAEEISKNKIVIIDAALLFDMGLNKICDMTIGINSSFNTCVKRICKRDNISEELAKARIKSQNGMDYFKINCTYCIENEEEKDLIEEIKAIFEGKNLSNKNMIHIHSNGVEYLQFRKLLEYSKNIEHCYTLRPLDFKNVEEKFLLGEYDKICRALKIDRKNIYRPRQTHSCNISKVEEEEPQINGRNFQNIDGLITNKKNKILSLTFADCICLYFYDPVKNVIGNIHSGWRGTYGQIAKIAVKKLEEEYDVNPENLICGISPSIKKCSFEVDEDVKDMFYEKFKVTGYIDEIIKKSETNNKYYIDTSLINRIILSKEGLKEENIIDSEICTKCNSNKLHSYREDKELSGRNTGLITLKD